MSLFDLVEEHDGIGLAPYLFGELAAVVVVVPDISRGRADELGDGVLFHELRHIQPYHQLFVAEHALCERLGKVGLAHARGADKYEGAYRLVRLIQPRSCPADGAGDGGDGLVLADYALVQVLLQMQQLFALLLCELGDGHARPTADDIGNLLRAYACSVGIGAALPVFLCGVYLLLDGVYLLYQLLRLRIIFVLCGLCLFLREPL